MCVFAEPSDTNTSLLNFLIPSSTYVYTYIALLILVLLMEKVLLSHSTHSLQEQVER